MNAHPDNRPVSGRSEEAFNLVEVALALAIFAFALTAIFGVLPAGVTAQRDSRDETIINYDARYWMEAIRSGQMPQGYNADGSVKEWQAVSHKALTNHVYWVRVERPASTNLFTYAQQSDWPESVIGRLSFPDALPDSTPPEGGIKKVAKVRSLTGRMGNPLAGSNPSFHYFLETSITPLTPQRTDLYQLRLTFKWPILTDAAGNETIGTSAKTFTTLVSGTLFGGYFDTNAVPTQARTGFVRSLAVRTSIPIGSTTSGQRCSIHPSR